jgi:hypothetical protein
MPTAPDLSTAAWRKSSRSHDPEGACVEVADNIRGVIPVRDSKDHEGAVLVFRRAAWSAFLMDVKADHLRG